MMLIFCSEVWARFLAFESNIGDLASILKVERRRFSAFKDEYEGKETALLVDRYKFMDLYPCSASELKALGYKVCFKELLLPDRACLSVDTQPVSVVCFCRTCLVPNWQHCSQRRWWRPLRLY